MNKPTFKSTRLRAAAMALTLSAALGQALLAPADAFAASEPAIKLMTLRGVDVQASDPEGDGTRYTARARHWNVDTAQQHADMGFEEGWGICADQLKALCEAG